MPNHQEINFLGRIIDREKQAPVSRAKVILNFPGAPPVVYTDLEGIYRFPVNFGDSSIIKGQITIEADGYKTCILFIKLSPKNTDLGDIRLVTPDYSVSSSNISITTNDMLMPIMTALMIALSIIMIAVLTQPSPENTPQQIPEPSHNYKNYKLESYFSQHFAHLSTIW